MIRDAKSNRPDEELARLAADGDAAAFDEIYSRHRRFVYNLAVRMTGNQADAEDLTPGIILLGLLPGPQLQGRGFVHDVAYRLVIQSGQDALPLSRFEAGNAD